MILKASEKQIIISIKNLLTRNEPTSLENLESFGTMFFCSYKKDWNNSFDSLINKGIISTEKSEAHSKLCKSAYGIDLCQTGMMTLNQLNYITQNIIGTNKCCLDLGCGSGHISEYIADICTSNVVGIDIIASGIKVVFDNRLIETEDLSKLAIEEKLFRYLYIINKN